jgi:tRNA pseudouridine38-40 synthase
MTRYFVQASYNGTNYHGWQIQPNAKTIQETINHVFSTKLQQEINVVGAGRTDTGVHASFYVFHFDINTSIKDIKELIYRLNRFLPYDIKIQTLFKVDIDYHSRFNAQLRSYKYIISKEKAPFLNDFSYQLKQPIDIDVMNELSSRLIGEKDFSSFCKSGTDTETNICNISHAQWIEKGNLFIFEISADRFLRNMVRAVVGTCIDAGLHKIKPSDIEHILASKNRSNAGTSVPAKGLFLTDIQYDKNIQEQFTAPFPFFQAAFL